MGTDPTPYPQRSKSFFNYLLIMPKSHKRLFITAVLLAGAGTIGQMSSFMSRQDQAPLAVMPTTEPSMGPSNSIVADPAGESAPVATEPAPTMVERLAPVSQKLGFGFIGGFILGWIFRTFLKIMSLITMAGVALFAGLSWMGVDLSPMREKFESGIGWMSQQGDDLYDKVQKRLPSAGAGFAGVFFGFKRKKILTRFE